MKVDPAMLRKLRQVEGPVLSDLAPLTTEHASGILMRSLFEVPVQDEAHHDPSQPHLAETGFIDGPEINEARKSVSSTCGYEHPAAGAIHEGFHFGMKTKQAPNFLRAPARTGRGQFRTAVAKQIQASLSRLFPAT